MPRCKRLQSLQYLTLVSIAKNMDSVWCKQYLETYKEKRFFRFVAGPFDNVPPNLLVMLIRILREQRQLKKHHLELFIVSQLDVLELGREYEDICHPLKLVSFRCPNLKVLKLSHCQRIPKYVYQEIFPQLVELQILDLSGTKSGDSSLCIIGSHCRMLRELNITSCPVTDEGIKGLCVGVDDLGPENHKLGQCKQISKLYINYTNITDKGIALVLQNLKFLQKFDCCGSVQVLAKMHQLLYENNLANIPQYCLLDLDCSESIHVNYISRGLHIAAELCPFVTKVRLVAQPELTDTDLEALLYLSNLQELCISGGEVCLVSFSNGVVPVLKASGQCLQSLTLAELNNIDIGVIVECCQNLKILQLIMNHSYDIRCSDSWAIASNTGKSVSSLGLTQLESLHLVCVTHFEAVPSIPAAHLMSLLYSEQLVHIYIKECPTLNDTVFRGAYERNKFPKLEHLELEQCNAITENAITLLMNSSNPLKVLKLWECRQLTKQNVHGWEKLARAFKWELSLDWS